MRIIQNGRLIGTGSNFVLEHFFVNGMMSVGIKVVIFGSSIFCRATDVVAAVVVAAFGGWTGAGRKGSLPRRLLNSGSAMSLLGLGDRRLRHGKARSVAGSY
jgi:hypothetical protein